MPYVWEFLKLHTFKGFMVKTDRNSAEDFCHPPGAVCSPKNHIMAGPRGKRDKG